MVRHWDEVAWERVDVGMLRWDRQRLGGLSRYRLPAGAQLMPAHVHVDEDEHVVVMTGGGFSIHDGTGHTVRAGDVIAHPADTHAHTMLAGTEGLEVLIFASGSPTGLTRLPRSGLTRVGAGLIPPWSSPFEAEPPLPAPAPAGPPPAMTCRLSRLERVELGEGDTDGEPRWHSARREEIVVVGGDGTLLLGDAEEPLRAGNVIHRAPSTGVPHALRGPLSAWRHYTTPPGDLVFAGDTLTAGGQRYRLEHG
jgi:uncharacterized cupin superfamily protein